MISDHTIKEKLRFIFYHAPKVGLDVLRTEGVLPLLAKAGRFIRQTVHPGEGQRGVPARKSAKKRRGGWWKKSGKREAYFNYIVETTGTGKEYVPISHPYLPETDIKIIAFYLPQFHPIPENDEWWGKGFTEWTNVTRAVPQFIGHHQPKLPGELGFYDLRLKEVQRRQVELAKQYGLHGFCFHYYWFGGKRLLELPLERYLQDQDIDFPFCISWANENWSRAWDGMDDRVLIGQKHSPEDDIAFIEHVSKYLMDDRYIRIGSRPLLMVYRPALMPEPEKTAERWRQWCRDNGVGEIYLALTHSFEHLDPREIGFDAAVEFAPNTFPLKDVAHRFDIVNPEFQGRIFDYESAVDLARDYRTPLYTKFRSLCPGWDNDARRPGRGNTLTNSTPEAYKDWLRLLCEFTTKNFPRDERLVFVNAWNEWAEGAYLEPDRKYGYAYLAATADVLSPSSAAVSAAPGRWQVLFVSHDASMAGAQAVLLGVISWFKDHTNIDLKILCLNGGGWLHRFTALGDTLVLDELRKKGASDDELVRRIEEFCGGRPDLVYGNSMVAGREYRLLGRLGAPIVTHLHELEMSIKRYAASWVDEVLKHSGHFIACSTPVGENLVRNHGVDPSRITTAHASVRPDSSIRIADDEEKRRVRKRLGLMDDKLLVFGCGIGMASRKGADLFIDAARALRARGMDNFHFYWVGGFDAKEHDDRHGVWAGQLNAMSKEGLDGYVTFLGFRDNPREFLQAGDVFLLTSREDPFPLVALEAAECGLPVVCFAEAGGMPGFVGEDAGFVVPYGDAEAMAEKVAVLMKDKELRLRLGARGREKLLSGFTFDQTTPHVLSACRNAAGKKPAVSVIVPNYNHARYLPARLDSIFNQTFRDFEVILLDDASTDDSMEILGRYADRADVRIVRNEQNSGSSFRQWLKGIDLANADVIWIAESDDVSDPRFLETLLPAFSNPDVKLAYTDSSIMDEDGNVSGRYADSEYLTALSKTKWKRGYEVPANREVNDGLGVKNTVLNVSAALYRKFELDEEFRERVGGMRMAGDWYFAAHAIRGGKVHYDAARLNYHRRHTQSVIGKAVSDKKTEDFFREFHAVQSFIFDNYELDEGFEAKWEGYLRWQWDEFCPGRPFEELKGYYPFDAMKEKLLSYTSADSGRLVTQAQTEASVWITSPYYDHAEQFMHIFWGENSSFRPLFEQLDLSTVIELACGHGRHAEHVLGNYAQAVSRMVCMDVNDSNIEFCKKRLQNWKDVDIIKNNGVGYRPMGDNSVTSIFCYDAMVHFHKDVVGAYLKDTYRVLKPGGRALYHHSNYSENPNTSFGQNPHARAFMTQELFRQLSGQASLTILHQEVITWGNVKDIDCVTLLEKPAE